MDDDYFNFKYDSFSEENGPHSSSKLLIDEDSLFHENNDFGFNIENNLNPNKILSISINNISNNLNNINNIGTQEKTKENTNINIISNQPNKIITLSESPIITQSPTQEIFRPIQIPDQSLRPNPSPLFIVFTANKKKGGVSKSTKKIIPEQKNDPKRRKSGSDNLKQKYGTNFY